MRIALLTCFIFISAIAIGQCPIGLTLGTTELVTNGDFGAGNTGFSSDYTYCTTNNCLQPEGFYTVAANPNFYHSGFDGSDHTSGSGPFLIVNGSQSSSNKVWCQTITVEPNKFYIFSYWLSTMVSQSPAQLQTKMNGINLMPPFDAPVTTFDWVQFVGIWNAGTNTSVEICIYNNNTALGGNDFGIDDISFIKCECDLEIDAGPGGSICPGASIQLDGSLSISYFWFPSAGLDCTGCEDPVASPDTSTWYYASVNGAGDCFLMDSVLVEVYPLLDLNAQNDTTICAGESVQLNASNAESYEWSPSATLTDPDISNPVASPISTTTYYVEGMDVNDCVFTDSVTVSIFNAGAAPDAFPDTVVCEWAPVLLTAIGGISYSWSPDVGLSCIYCANPMVNVGYTTTYTVSVIDSNGCDGGETQVTVTIDSYCIHFDIPTAFSPNNDGINDEFNILGSGVAAYKLSIYNRWGELLFVTNEIGAGWDGNYFDEPQSIGVYTWHLEILLADGTSEKRNGNVTLVR